MGSYAELSLGPFILESSKNEVDPFVMPLFRESDKRVIRLNQEQAIQKGYDIDPDFFKECEFFTILEYGCRVYAIKDRLNLMGFTLEAAEIEFNQALAAELETYENSSLTYNYELYEDQMKLLEKLNLPIWLSCLKEIHDKNLQPGCENFDIDSDKTPFLKYMLGHTSLYGYPNGDLRHFLRLAIEVCSSEDELLYDLTELKEGGWIEETDNLVCEADSTISIDFEYSKRIIILTEGISDKWIIEQSLNAFYPHLAEYFHFLDFKETRVPGGSGYLTNIVKAFAGAGIINRILALFDNDTAGLEAINLLTNIKLPSNIVALKYPPLEYATNYPTLGPNGLTNMDINGLACSIELYLGKDVLTTDDGNLIPIQWTGYNRKLYQYQGEILEKEIIQKRYEKKLKSFTNNSNQSLEYDWFGINQILNSILTAFHPC